MSAADLSSLFSRLQNLSLTSNLPAALPDYSHYDLLAAASTSQFIYFARLTRPVATPATNPGPVSVEDTQLYVPFFTDHYHTLLHEIAHYYELPNGVADIKALHVRGEGTEADGNFAELDLGLENITVVDQWEVAKALLADMGYGSNPKSGAGEMGEAVLVVVEVY